MSRVAKATAVFAVSLALVAAFSVAAVAAPVEASAAQATPVQIYADLFGAHVMDATIGPVSKAPDGGQNSTSGAFLGPYRYPEDTGSLVSEISALKTSAARSAGTNPTAHAESHSGHVALLEQSGVPLIGVDAIDSIADARCSGGRVAISTDGTKLVGLTIAGTTYSYTPNPNTRVDLVWPGDPADGSDDMGVRVILNEQTGANAGTGIIVTALHVIAFSPANPNIIYADVRIAESQAAVWCGDGTEPTDNNTGRDVVIDKIVTSTTSDAAGATDGSTATAHRGDTVTWKITIHNNDTSGCSLLQVTDTLPAHFTFVSTSGDLSDGAAAEQDGQDLVWTNGGRYSLPASGTLTETIVARVDADAPYGTYVNLLNVNQSTCSSFTAGLRGPVEVIPLTAVRGKQFRRPAPVAAQRLPSTGVGTPIALAIMMLTGAAVGFEVLRRDA